MGMDREHDTQQGWSCGGTEHISQIRPKMTDSHPKSLGQLTDFRGTNFSFATLDEAQMGARNSCDHTNFLARHIMIFDVFGDIHAGFLHYVKFKNKGIFT